MRCVCRVFRRQCTPFHYLVSLISADQTWASKAIHSPTPKCVILGLLSSPNNLVKSGVADDEEADAVVVVLAVVEVVDWAEVLVDSVVVVSSGTLEVGWVARAGNGQLRPKGKGRTHIQHIAIAVLRV